MTNNVSVVDQLKKKVAKLEAELARYSMCAGHADQRRAESRACREALGFDPDSEHVSPSDLLEAIAKSQQAADRTEQLERQMLTGLRALGIACNSIDQCVSFEREVAGTVSVLEERMRRAEKQRDQAVNKIVRWCEDPQHRRNRTLNQQCEMLDQLRSEMLDISREY